MKDKSIISLFMAIASFTIWGLFPLYWKQIAHINALETLAFRGVFSVLFAGIFVILFKEMAAVKKVITNKKLLLAMATSSFMIASNWGIYIWAVNNNNITESSMGYYINPLLNVLASAIIFNVRLNKVQILSIVLVCMGVGYMLIGYGAVPFVALSLATSFCLYGVIRKIAPISTFAGLLIEACFIAIPASIYLSYLYMTGTGTYLHASGVDMIYIVFSGFVTTVPLAGFAYAAKNLHLSTLGIVQYITPTVSLLLGIFLYKEVFTMSYFITFMFIWLAVIIYTADGLLTYRKQGK